MSSTSIKMSNHSDRRLSILHVAFLVLMVSSAAQGANQRFCGRQLVTMMSMLCEEFPDLHSFSKKSMTDFDKPDYSSALPSSEEWLSSMVNPNDQSTTDLMTPSDHHMLDQPNSKVPHWMAMVYPFRTGVGSNDLIPSRFRKSRGIVEECCMKPCGIKDLLRYCRVPAF